MGRNFWYFFANNNWHNGGNSTEQYARALSVSPSVYVHGARNRKQLTYNKLHIIPQTKEYVIPSLRKESRVPKIAMFAKPTKLFLDYMKIAKDLNIKVIYRVVDDWSLWRNNEWYDEKVELSMIKLADVAVATSLKLANKLGIRQLPNACQKCIDNPIKFNVIPIIGFLGDVDNQVSSARFDMELVVYLAKKFPDFKFKLIGSRKEWSALPKNIEVFKYLQWKEANMFLSHIDIGLISYKGEDVSGVQPTKSWEYAGYGLPQICRKGLDLPDHVSVYTYETYEECAKILSNLANELDNIDRDNIIKYATEHTWLKRTEQLLKWLKLYEL